MGVNTSGDDAADLAETVIEPRAGWRLVNVRELWEHRELLYFLAWGDVKVRDKQTLLGAAWAVLQPALMMAVFTVFLGGLARVPAGDIPYPVFVYIGLLPWTFFATAITNAGSSVVESERVITKVYFPRLVVPLAAAGAALVDFVIALGLLVLLMIFYRVPTAWSVLLTPLLAGFTLLAAVGVGTLLAALNVRYRDFRYVVPFLMQLWMFATPTIYMVVQPASNIDPELATVPVFVHYLLQLNPMTGLIAFFRSAVLGETLPWMSLAYAASVIVAIFLLGCMYFRRVEDSFADVI